MEAATDTVLTIVAQTAVAHVLIPVQEEANNPLTAQVIPRL